MSSDSNTASINLIPPNPPKKRRNKRKKMKNGSISEDSDSSPDETPQNVSPKVPPDATTSNDADEENPENPPSLIQIFSPLEENIKRFADNYPISLENLRVCVDMCKDNKQAVETVKEFTNDLEGLRRMLKDNYKFLQDRKMKTKFTKIINKLDEELSLETTPNM